MSVRASATAVASGLLLLVPSAVAPAHSQVGGGANNIVHVVNTVAGDLTSRASVQAAPYGGPSAQSTNLAFADARDCDGCRTHAAALQAVFLTGDPDVVQVANAAVATNSSCTRCVTYAYAFQYVVSTDRAVSLSPAGRVRLAELSRRVDAAVARPAATLEDLAAVEAELDALAAELVDVVESELRAGGHQAVTRTQRDREVREN